MAIVPHGAGGSTVSFSLSMLMPENYTVWAIKAEAILDAQSFWEVVSPADGAAIDDKKNKAAKAQLFGALSEDILMQVSTKKTAVEVWASLKTRFVGADRVRAARLSTLHGEFDRLRMKDGEALDAYARKISGMAARRPWRSYVVAQRPRRCGTARRCGAAWCGGRGGAVVHGMAARRGDRRGARWRQAEAFKATVDSEPCQD